MARITFEALLQSDTASGGAFVAVPGDVRAVFGRARPRVRVTINGHTWRSTLSVYGRASLLGINRAHREAAGVAPGDTVAVVVESDEEPRTVEVPAELAAALAASPEAQGRFDAMPYTHRLEYVRWVEEAKRPETRARRIPAAIERILAGKTAG